MTRLDALVLIVASVFIAVGVAMLSIPAGLVAVGVAGWALVLVDRDR